MGIDWDEAKRHLSVFGSTRVTIQTADDKKEKRKYLSRILHGEIDDLMGEIENLNRKGAGIHLLVNTGDFKGRKKNNILGIRVLFIDTDGSLCIDPKSGMPKDEAYPLPHSALIESSPGKWHVYWLIKDCPLEQFENLQKALAVKYASDKSVADISRVMRIAGTLHQKGEPVRVALRSANPKNIYTLAQFVEVMGLAEIVEQQAFENENRDEARQVRVQAATDYVSGTPSRELVARLFNDALNRLAKTKEGGRNNYVYAIAADFAGFAAQGEIDVDVLRRQLLRVTLEIGLDEKEAMAAISNGIKDGWDTPKSPDLTDYAETDYGDAERLYTAYGDKFRYAPAKGVLVWDAAEGLWRHDEGEAELKRFAVQSARLLEKRAVAITDDVKRLRVLRYAISREAVNKLRATVELVKTIPDVRVKMDDFDKDPLLLNVANGTLDLRTGQLRPHDPGDRMTKRSSVVYDPSATCPRWLQFAHEIAGGDEELVAWKQRMFGYTLTGLTNEQIMCVLYGAGSNGKSTELGVISALLGGYTTPTQFDTFAERKSEGVRNDLADLVGARFVPAFEGESGQRLAEGLVKQATGGDPIKARFLHREYFSFVPTFKVFLATNHKPVIRGVDHGIWRRLRLVPYNMQFDGSQRDDKLSDKLSAELSGILNWTLEGCRQWQQSGLGTAHAVQQATESYRKESDKLADFLAECCVCNEEYSTKAGGLYQAYERFANENGENAFSGHTFGKMLSERGFAPGTGRIEGKSCKIRRGLRLKGEERS